MSQSVVSDGGSSKQEDGGRSVVSALAAAAATDTNSVSSSSDVPFRRHSSPAYRPTKIPAFKARPLPKFENIHAKHQQEQTENSKSPTDHRQQQQQHETFTTTITSGSPSTPPLRIYSKINKSSSNQKQKQTHSPYFSQRTGGGQEGHDTPDLLEDSQSLPLNSRPAEGYQSPGRDFIHHHDAARNQDNAVLSTPKNTTKSNTTPNNSSLWFSSTSTSWFDKPKATDNDDGGNDENDNDKKEEPKTVRPPDTRPTQSLVNEQPDNVATAAAASPSSPVWSVEKVAATSNTTSSSSSFSWFGASSWFLSSKKAEITAGAATKKEEEEETAGSHNGQDSSSTASGGGGGSIQANALPKSPYDPHPSPASPSPSPLSAYSRKATGGGGTETTTDGVSVVSSEPAFTARGHATAYNPNRATAIKTFKARPLPKSTFDPPQITPTRGAPTYSGSSGSISGGKPPAGSVASVASFGATATSTAREEHLESSQPHFTITTPGVTAAASTTANETTTFHARPLPKSTHKYVAPPLPTPPKLVQRVKDETVAATANDKDNRHEKKERGGAADEMSDEPTLATEQQPATAAEDESNKEGHHYRVEDADNDNMALNDTLAPTFSARESSAHLTTTSKREKELPSLAEEQRSPLGEDMNPHAEEQDHVEGKEPDGETAPQFLVQSRCEDKKEKIDLDQAGPLKESLPETNDKVSVPATKDEQQQQPSPKTTATSITPNNDGVSEDENDKDPEIISKKDILKQQLLRAALHEDDTEGGSSLHYPERSRQVVEELLAGLVEHSQDEQVDSETHGAVGEKDAAMLLATTLNDANDDESEEPPLTEGLWDNATNKDDIGSDDGKSLNRGISPPVDSQQESDEGGQAKLVEPGTDDVLGRSRDVKVYSRSNHVDSSSGSVGATKEKKVTIIAPPADHKNNDNGEGDNDSQDPHGIATVGADSASLDTIGTDDDHPPDIMVPLVGTKPHSSEDAATPSVPADRFRLRLSVARLFRNLLLAVLLPYILALAVVEHEEHVRKEELQRQASSSDEPWLISKKPLPQSKYTTCSFVPGTVPDTAHQDIFEPYETVGGSGGALAKKESPLSRLCVRQINVHLNQPYNSSDHVSPDYGLYEGLKHQLETFWNEFTDIYMAPNTTLGRLLEQCSDFVNSKSQEYFDKDARAVVQDLAERTRDEMQEWVNKVTDAANELSRGYLGDDIDVVVGRSLKASSEAISDFVNQLIPQDATYRNVFHEPAGQHLVVDVSHVDPRFLSNMEAVARALVLLVQEARMTLLSYHCNEWKSNNASSTGVSCVGIILESHVAVHTWPREGILSLDFFACGSTSLLPFLPLIRDLFAFPVSLSLDDVPVIRWIHKKRGFRGLFLDRQEEPGGGLAPSGMEKSIPAELSESSVKMEAYLLGWMGYEEKTLLADVRTPHQQIQIYQVSLMAKPPLSRQQCENCTAHETNKLLYLDGIMRSSLHGMEPYHGALVQPALLLHDDPRRVAIVGGAEGATLQQVLKHQYVESVVMVERDTTLVDLAKEYLPEWNDCGHVMRSSASLDECDAYNVTRLSCFDDPRLQLHLRDGVEWFRERYGSNAMNDDRKHNERFDVIILDAFDPPSLIKQLDEASAQDFVAALVTSLGPNGILVSQFGEAGSAPIKDEFSRLLQANGVQAMRNYHESHCQLRGPIEYRVYFRNATSAWLEKTETQVGIQMAKRYEMIQPFEYVDEATFLASYQYPDRLTEDAFCDRYSCHPGGFDSESENIPVSELKIKEARRMSKVHRRKGVFTQTRRFSKGSYLFLEEMVNRVVLAQPTLHLIESVSDALGSSYHGAGLLLRPCGGGSQPCHAVMDRPRILSHMACRPHPASNRTRVGGAGPQQHAADDDDGSFFHPHADRNLFDLAVEHGHRLPADVDKGAELVVYCPAHPDEDWPSWLLKSPAKEEDR